jgi:tyrosyl-tRNA synthetase
MKPSDRKANIVSIQMQLKHIWKNVEQLGNKYGYQREWAWRRAICNNNTWLNGLSLIEFLRILGRGARMGPMLSRDTCVPAGFLLGPIADWVQCQK